MNLLIITQKMDKYDPVLGFFHRWVEEFAKNVESVIVICLEEGEHKLPQNVRVRSLGKESGKSRLKYIFRFYKYIWQERRSYNAVFVHMNQIYVIMGGALWRTLRKKTALWYAHGSVSLTLRIAEKLSAVIFTTTRHSFRLKSKKLNIVGHGIDVEEFKSKDTDKFEEFTIISVGRISPVKDYDTLLKAVDLLRRKGIIFKVLIVGGAGTPDQDLYFNDLKKSTAQMGLSDIVKFTGPLLHSDVPKFLERSHLFVHTSRTGSLDKVVLEAMALELPVISANESVGEIFPDDLRATLTFSPGAVENLSNKIGALLRTSEGDRSRIGKRLCHIAEKDHNIKNLIPKIISVLQ